MALDENAVRELGRIKQRACISRLALNMSTAASDGEAFRLAGDACYSVFDGVCFVSLAIVTKDGDLNHFKLNSTCSASHSHLGMLQVLGTAAGFAVHTKEIVSTGDISRRTPAFADWMELKVAEKAVSVISVPLVLADTAIGCITLASEHANAFNGQHSLVEMLAAVLAPYLGLQKFRKELKAIEGVLHQMVPMKVALRLTEIQTQAVNQPPAFCTYQSPFARNPTKGSHPLNPPNIPEGKAASDGVQPGAPSPSSHPRHFRDPPPVDPPAASAYVPMNSLSARSVQGPRGLPTLQPFHKPSDAGQHSSGAGSAGPCTVSHPAVDDNSGAAAAAGPSTSRPHEAGCKTANHNLSTRQQSLPELHPCFEMSSTGDKSVAQESQTSVIGKLKAFPTSSAGTSSSPDDAAPVPSSSNEREVCPPAAPRSPTDSHTASSNTLSSTSTSNVVFPISCLGVAACVRLVQPDSTFSHFQKKTICFMMLAVWTLFCVLLLLSSTFTNLQRMKQACLQGLMVCAAVLYTMCQCSWLSQLSQLHPLLHHLPTVASVWNGPLKGTQVAGFGFLLCHVLGFPGVSHVQMPTWLKFAPALLHIILSMLVSPHLAVLLATASTLCAHALVHALCRSA